MLPAADVLFARPKAILTPFQIRWQLVQNTTIQWRKTAYGNDRMQSLSTGRKYKTKTSPVKNYFIINQYVTIYPNTIFLFSKNRLDPKDRVLCVKKSSPFRKKHASFPYHSLPFCTVVEFLSLRQCRQEEVTSILLRKCTLFLFPWLSVELKNFSSPFPR